jgi:hypothetical protein
MPGWIQPKRDRAFLAGQLQDFHTRNIAPGVLIVPELPPGKEYNTLYQEEVTYNRALRRGQRYSISVKVLAPPSPKILKKYGIDQHRSIQLSFPVDTMAKLGFSKVEVGWVFIYLDETYRITEFFPQAYTDHHGSFLYWVSFAVKQRSSSIEPDPETILSPTADTIFGSKRDARFLSSLSGVFYRKAIPNILLFERPSDIDIDLLYGEDFPDFFMWDRYSAPFYTTWEPQDDFFKKSGLEETRTIQFSISVAAFSQLNIPLPPVGSVFVIEGEFYRINDIHPLEYLGTTGLVATMVGSGWKVKPSSIPGAFNPAVHLYAVNKNTLLLPIQDVAFQAANQADLFRRAFDVVSFFIRDRTFNVKSVLDSKGLVHPDRFREEVRSTSPELDLLYNEDSGEYRIPGTQYDLPGYVRVNPTKTTLKKYGLTTDRDILVWLSIELLGQLGYDVLPNYGDVFLYQGEYYRVTNQDPAFYFSNTERYTAISVFGNKLRQSSFDTAPLIQAIPDGGYARRKGNLDPFPMVTGDLYGESNK